MNGWGEKSWFVQQGFHSCCYLCSGGGPGVLIASALLPSCSWFRGVLDTVHSNSGKKEARSYLTFSPSFVFLEVLGQRSWCVWGLVKRKMKQRHIKLHWPVWLSRTRVVQAPPQLQPLSLSPPTPTNSLVSCGSRMEGGTVLLWLLGTPSSSAELVLPGTVGKAHSLICDNPGSSVFSSHCCCHGSGRFEAKCSLQPTKAKEHNPTSASITAFYTGHSNLQNCSCILLKPDWFRAHPKDTCPYFTFLRHMWDVLIPSSSSATLGIDIKSTNSIFSRDQF